MNLQPSCRDPEGRPRALIHHAAVPLRLSPFALPRPFYPNGVHAVRRQQLARIGRREVRRRHPDRLAPSRPALDRPRDAVRPPQPAPGEVQLPVRHGGADQRRGDRLAVFADRVHHVHREPVRGAETPHRFHVAGAPAPEAVVVAQHQLPHGELRSQHVADELLGAEPRQVGREWEHRDAVHARPGEQLSFFVRERQQLRRRRRVDDFERVGLEGHQHALEPPPPRLRPPHDLRQPRLVAAMHAVEGAARPYRPARAHSATTTRGLSRSPTRSATAMRWPFANRATLPSSSFSAGTGRPWRAAARPASSNSRRGRSATSAASSRKSAAVTTWGATASSRRNGPTRVRRSAAKCRPHPKASPTSRARLRRYVPPLTTARNWTSGGAKATSSSSWNSTSRSGSSTGSPRRARR